MEKRICDYCGQSLRSIGTSRKNGRDNLFDWTKRKYHKKCFREKSLNEKYKKTI